MKAGDAMLYTGMVLIVVGHWVPAAGMIGATLIVVGLVMMGANHERRTK